LKTLHEIGHFIDLEGLPGDGFSSTSADELADWRAAVRLSDALQGLASLARTESGDRLRPIRAALAIDEVWARSYAQFISSRSGDRTLRDEVEALRAGRFDDVSYPLQWVDDDFAPIAAAIAALLRKLAWTT
jgi:hypothetical protein